MNRHLDSASKCRAEASRLSEECAALTAQCSSLKEQLNASDARLLQRDKTISAAMEEWHHKVWICVVCLSHPCPIAVSIDSAAGESSTPLQRTDCVMSSLQ